MTDDVRKIDARVEIAYGNEEIADALRLSSVDANAASCFSNLFGNRNAPAVMAFTLEGTADNALGSGRGLADPDIVGWWSKSFCSAEPEKKDGVPVGSYPFAQPPTLTVDFGSPRPVRIVQIYGDVMLGEFPTRLRIRLFRGADKYAAGENCREVVYDNSSVQAEFDLTKDADGNAITGLVNGYVNGITHMTVEILAWNKPARMSKIYRCYDDIIERYGSDELKCFECIRELPDSDGLSYGLVSGSCSVTLHNKDRKFDRGYLKTLAHINKRVVPYINGEKLGSFYIKEWDISQSDMFVKCDANDRLLDFQDMMYDGRMPREVGEKLGFKTLFGEVLENAKNRLVQGFNYSVDEELDEWAVEPYLPRKSVWDVLQMLCDASMSFVYVGKDDVIYVKSELTERKTPESNVVISPENAFSMDIPFFADMEVGIAEVPYYRKVVKPDQELYRINDYNAEVGQTVTIPVEFDKYCEIEKVTYGETEYILSKKQFELNKKDDSDFKYEIILVVKNKEDEKNDLVVYGKEIKFEKQSLEKRAEDNAKSTMVTLYTHPDCELIQSAELAAKIRDRLLQLYPTGTRSASSTWRGAEKLDLMQTAKIEDRFKETTDFMVTQIKNTVDGGFKQEIKGVKTAINTEKTQKHSIDIIGGT